MGNFMGKERFTPEQQEFLKIIHTCRQRMNGARTWNILTTAMAVGLCCGILLEAASFLLPFYYADLCALLAAVSALLTGFALSRRRRVSMEAAALKIDSFGFEERIITAYETMVNPGDSSSPFPLLQQRDAMKHLRAGRDKIKIPLLPPIQKTGICFGLFLTLILLSLIPSPVKHRAEELHRIRQDAEEKQEEIEEVIAKLEEFVSPTLTEEQLAAVQEMIESLQSSAAEFGQAASPEALKTAEQKLDYKYGDMGRQLANLAEILQNGGTISLSTASDMQEISQRLQSMGQNNGGGDAGQGGPDSENNGQGSSNGQDGNGDNSQNGNGNGQNSNGNGQNGSGNGNGNSQDGNGDGNSQNGNGNNNGNNQNGNGQNGSGNGDGNSNGGGRGTGSADNPHDYVSIPNALGDDPSLTGQAGSSENMESFRAQNGLSWEGNHVSYESVIGEYQARAYEGISGGKYPSGMEDVIKEYFGSFNE